MLIWLGQSADQGRVGKGRGVDGDLVGTKFQDLAGIFHAFNATGNAEGDIDHLRYPAHPALVHYPGIAGGGDVIEHQLVSALFGVAARQLDNAAHHLVVAKLHPFDHHAIFYVETLYNTL